MSLRTIAPLLALFVFVTGCAQTDYPELDVAGEVDGTASSLSSAQRRVRAGQIRDAAAASGITTGFLLAGIADAETQMSQCWSELTWACKGPNSADCGGGPVVAGAGDGPCSARQGGLGMFQFDAGTFEQTLARDGNRVLTIAGNTAAAVEFVINMVINSAYVPNVSTRAEAIAWINGVTPTNTRFDPWVKTVTHYYNGCRPSYSCWSQRYGHYRDNALNVYSEMGAPFWQAQTPVSIAALEVYWARTATGQYDLRALAGANVTRVEYALNGAIVARATKANGANFPVTATLTALNESKLEVRGYDAQGQLVARGVGLLDVTDGVGVYIKQLGASLYEIGLERAPVGVASIEVKVDTYLLTDSVSGRTRSTRNAVRSRFTTLGPRDFVISTYNANGTLRGTLRRRFTLQ